MHAIPGWNELSMTRNTFVASRNYIPTQTCSEHQVFILKISRLFFSLLGMCAPTTTFYKNV